MRMFLVIIMAIGTACDGVPTDPDSLEGLELRFELDAESVEVGSSFIATVEVKNTTSSLKSFRSPHSCFVTPVVVRDGEDEERFSRFGCLTVSLEHRIAPGESLIRDFTIHVGTRSGSPPPGRYVVEARFQVSPRLPDLQETIEITI